MHDLSLMVALNSEKGFLLISLPVLPGWVKLKKAWNHSLY